MSGKLKINIRFIGGNWGGGVWEKLLLMVLGSVSLKNSQSKIIETKNKKVSHNVIARERNQRSNLDSKIIESKKLRF